MYNSRKKLKDYFLDGQNVTELILFTLSIVFVFIFPNNCGCPMNWQWNIGIFAVFLAWFNLLFFTSEIPYTGTYVLIFKEILVTFIKLTSFSIFIVMGFSLILFMMFFDPFAQVSARLVNTYQLLYQVSVLYQVSYIVGLYCGMSQKTRIDRLR